MSFAETLARARRLAILQGLKRSASYRANARLLRSYCEAVGITTLTSDLRDDLAYLEQRLLVKLDIEEDVKTATLTELGLDVANGHAVVADVDRPGPEA